MSLPMLAVEEPSAIPARLPQAVLNALASFGEAAAFLGLPPEHIDDLVRLRLLPCLQSGDERFFRMADLVDYQKASEAQTRAEADYPLGSFFDELLADGLYYQAATEHKEAQL